MTIFVASFINSGVILLFTNAHLDHSILNWIPINNQYSDLDKNWYIDISTALVKTMLIMACFPWIEFFMFGGIKLLLRIMDSGWYFSRTQDSEMRTKKKTHQQYMMLYAGPEYLMHFKYSSILVQVFVSFMYGMFIPVLFLTALFGMFNMYCVERLSLTYIFR